MSFLIRCAPLFDWRPSLHIQSRVAARWVCIISLLCLALALGGCSAVRLGYNNAPTVVYWWLDRYFDFDSAQGDRVQADLQTLHAWHRKEELPQALNLLQKLRVATPQTITPEQLCDLFGDLKSRSQVALDRMVPTLAAITPTLTDAQIEHIAQAFEKRNRSWQEDWTEGTPAQRAQRRTKQLISRAESFYGTLTPAQVALVQAQVNAFDVDPEVVSRSRVMRQKDALQTVRALRDNPAATPALRETELRALLVRAMNPVDPDMRATSARWAAQSCTGVAALHNSTSSAQRSELVENLKNYEEDVQALVDQR